MTQSQPPNPQISSLFELEYPQSVGVYASYAEAQKAVDFLADNKFAVENLAIVGTDLKSVERVTGRRNWGTVLWAGVQSGLSTGLMVALIMWFLQPNADPLSLLPFALGVGILIGVIFAAIGYATSQGKRDFTSISQTVATKYEVLCQHKVAGQARDLLRQLPGALAAQFDPRTTRAPQPADQSFPPPNYPAPGPYPGAVTYPAPNPYPGAPAQPPYQGGPYPGSPYPQAGYGAVYGGEAGAQPPAASPYSRPVAPPELAPDDAGEGRTPRAES